MRVSSAIKHPAVRWGVGGAFAILLVLLVLSGISTVRAVQQSQRDIHFLTSHEQVVSSETGRARLLWHLDDLESAAQRASSSIVVRGASTLLGWIPGLGPDVTNVTTLLHDEVVISIQGKHLLGAYSTFTRAQKYASGASAQAFATLRVAIAEANRAVAHLDPLETGLLNPLGGVEAHAGQKVRRVQTLLANATSALRVAQVILGEGTPQNVLVLPENNAEMRDQGSVLSYALLQAHDEHFTLLRSGHSYSLNLNRPVSYKASPGARAYYLVDGPSSFWQSINISGDFQLTGATAAKMFYAATGIHVDAVVALDVPAMAALTGVGGPLVVPGVGRQLTAQNFSTVVLHDLYSAYSVGPQYQRYDVLGQISSALLHRVEETKSSVFRYIRAIAPLIPRRHFLLWARNPSVQLAVQQLGADGQLDTVDPTSTFHVAVESDVADKMDYYVHVRERYVLSILPSGGATVRTIVTLINSAPTGQSPSYQLGPDHRLAQFVGQYVGNVYLWSPRGAHVSPGYDDAGLVLSAKTASVLASSETAVTFVSTIPHLVHNGVALLRLVPQSTLWPANYEVAVNEGSRTVLVAHGSLTQPVTVRMKVA